MNIRLYAVTLLLLPGLAQAAAVSGDRSAIRFSQTAGFSSVRVTGPQGFYAESASGVISGRAPLPDGQYRYEIRSRLSAAESTARAQAETLAPTRDQGRDAEAVRSGTFTTVADTGAFRIVAGQVVSGGAEEEEPEAAP